MTFSPCRRAARATPCPATSPRTAMPPRPRPQSGNVWRAHFAPDETGDWTYAVSFRTGSDVAIEHGDAGAGHRRGFFDGDSGSFHDRRDRQDRPRPPRQGAAAIRRQAPPALCRDRRVFPQGGGRCAGELPRLRRLRRHAERPGQPAEPAQVLEPACGRLRRRHGGAFTWQGGKGTEMLGRGALPVRQGAATCSRS